MSLGRYLVYRKDDGLIINCITYDGFSPYQLDAELAMELVPDNVAVDIGWIRQSNGQYTMPPVIEDATE
jgi:hypothetical protein